MLLVLVVTVSELERMVRVVADQVAMAEVSTEQEQMVAAAEKGRTASPICIRMDRRYDSYAVHYTHMTFFSESLTLLLAPLGSRNYCGHRWERPS